MKNTIRLNEAQLRSLVESTVREALAEYDYFDPKPKRPGIDTLYRMKWDYGYLIGQRFRGKSIKEVFEKFGLAGKDYIAYIYYKMPMIDYEQSILDALGMQPIEKPGKSDEAYQQWRQSFMESQPEEARREYEQWLMKKTASDKKTDKGKRIARYVSYSSQDFKKYAKRNLAWKNQGH